MDIKLCNYTCDWDTIFKIKQFGNICRLFTEISYLPGTEKTWINKQVSPGRGPSIALRSGWTLRSPQMRVSRVQNFC